MDNALIIVPNHSAMEYRHPGYFRCCCGCHVHDFVFVISLLNVIWCLVSGSTAFLSQMHHLLPIPVTLLILNALVLWGNRAEIPFLYLPALILQVLSATIIIGGAIGITAYGVYLSVAAIRHYGELDSYRRNAAFGSGLGVTLAGLVLLVVALLYAYLVEVFYRAYLFLKDRNARRRRKNQMPFEIDDF